MFLHSIDIKNINLNLFNLIITKSSNNSINNITKNNQLFYNHLIKLSDLELNEIFMENFKQEVSLNFIKDDILKEKYFLTNKNNDFHNLIIILFQLSYIIKNYKKIDFSDEQSQKSFYNELFSFVNFSISQLISLQNSYFHVIFKIIQDKFLNKFISKILSNLENNSPLDKSDLDILKIYKFLSFKNNESFENEIILSIKNNNIIDVQLHLDMIISSKIFK